MAVEMIKKSSSQEIYGRVKFAIKGLVLVVFLGWIFIWIMAPTNTYKQMWMPELGAKTTSTYFGAQ
ncbi:putative ferric reduction oxidase 2-like, partial [Sesbania bispinosa]